MDASRWSGERVLIYRHPVDIRKAIDGLSALVALELDRNPMDRCLYIFIIGYLNSDIRRSMGLACQANVACGTQ